MELVNNFDTTNDKITYLLLLKKSSIYTINKFDSMSDNEFILEIKSELKSIPNIIEIELSRLETLKNENLNKAIPKPSKLFSNNSGLDQNSSSIDKNSISMFTVATLAEYLGVSKSYIYKITHKNLISYSKPSGKKSIFIKKMWIIF